jgi:uncharacterized protein (TIGR02186 family)
MIARLLLLLPLWLLSMANAPVLVPDVSQDRISIRGDFTGAQLLLFGAISYPGQAQPSQDSDIVVVLKGPEQSIIVREKRQIAGIWVNADSSEFRSAPGYYAMASSRPIAKIVDDRTADIYELGLGHLQLSPAGRFDGAAMQRFTAGLVDLKSRSELYKSLENKVEISNGILYRARISLPASVPEGEYTAETFLVQKGRVVAAEVKDIRIEKQGMGRFITNMADNYGLFYGLFAVMLSVLVGWGAGYIFQKF